MRTTRIQPKPPTTRSRQLKLRKENPDLADLVAAKTLTLREAEAAAVARARERLERKRAENEHRPGDEWLRSNLPVPETDEDRAVYRRYIEAHQPSLLKGDDAPPWSLLQSVNFVHERCPFPCDEHKVKTPEEKLEEWHQFWREHPKCKCDWDKSHPLYNGGQLCPDCRREAVDLAAAGIKVSWAPEEYLVIWGDNPPS